MSELKLPKEYSRAFFVPNTYKEGTYILADIYSPETIIPDDSFIIMYNECCDIISNKSENYRLYQIGIKNILENTKVIYDNENTLSTIFIIDTNHYEIPFFRNYNDNFWSKLRKVNNDLQKCIDSISDKLISQLYEIKQPISNDLFIDYFFDGQAFDVNLRLWNGKILSFPNEEYLLHCLCVSVPKDNMFMVMQSVVFGIYNKLSYEIPNKFKVAENFKLQIPIMYD